MGACLATLLHRHGRKKLTAHPLSSITTSLQESNHPSTNPSIRSFRHAAVITPNDIELFRASIGSRVSLTSMSSSLNKVGVSDLKTIARMTPPTHEFHIPIGRNLRENTPDLQLGAIKINTEAHLISPGTIASRDYQWGISSSDMKNSRCDHTGDTLNVSHEKPSPKPTLRSLLSEELQRATKDKQVHGINAFNSKFG